MEVDVVSVEVSVSKASSSLSPVYEELLEVVTLATVKLSFDWPVGKQEVACRCNFLVGAFCYCQISIPRCRKCGRTCIVTPGASNYLNVDGLNKQKYMTIPRVEETLTLQLSLI